MISPAIRDEEEAFMRGRVKIGLAIMVPLLILLTSAPATAFHKCLVEVWIDGWRCAIGI